MSCRKEEKHSALPGGKGKKNLRIHVFLFFMMERPLSGCWDSTSQTKHLPRAARDKAEPTEGKRELQGPPCHSSIFSIAGEAVGSRRISGISDQARPAPILAVTEPGLASLASLASLKLGRT
jgi:hypothetical protein